MQERSSKKKRKKDKKHRVSDIDTRESLDENRSSREAPSKDESSLKSSTKDQSFRESPVRSFMKSAAPSRESSSSREKMSTNDRTSKGTLFNYFCGGTLLLIHNLLNGHDYEGCFRRKTTQPYSRFLKK